MSNKSLKKFNKVTSVNQQGELIMSAGIFSRGAIVAAFEMIGGVEAFAEWAGENKDDFYTKVFTKIIGRESSNKRTDDLEELLDIIDGEAEEVKEESPTSPVYAEFTEVEPVRVSMKDKMADAAKKYAQNEPAFA